jgi:hypothetical protein
MIDALKQTKPRRICHPMVHSLLRPLLAFLVALALIGAPVASQAAMPCHGMCDTPAAHHNGTSTLPAPCKGLMPTCMSALTCLSTIAVPPLPFSAAPQMAALPVAYWAANSAAHGHIVEPGLDPPIAS